MQIYNGGKLKTLILISELDLVSYSRSRILINAFFPLNKCR